MNEVVLITGASSGMGKETAILLKENGYIVYGAARNMDKMKDLETYGINILYLDITDEYSIQKCVGEILKKEGKIDILINNAGYGSYGAIEDVPIEEAKRQFEVNIFGLARITQLVLPNMRKNKKGKIINISSIGGKMYTPFGGWYHATKHALEGFSDCLRYEVKDFGIDVIIIEPGGIKTPWGIIAAENLRKRSLNGPYAKKAKKIADSMEKMYSKKNLTHPNVIAKTILKAIKAKNPKTRYLKGYMAKSSVFIRNLLGDKIFDKLLDIMYK
ncbi:oxidoreductase [Marinitoga lauensis]|uniref:oxidoreductase n=1 Tax=Marinitoga lauensis TaxID=2201189 RepID=UPI001981A8C4|nr:oxidoreductase [Marinitoga lauensis]